MCFKKIVIRFLLIKLCDQRSGDFLLCCVLKKLLCDFFSKNCAINDREIFYCVMCFKKIVMRFLLIKLCDQRSGDFLLCYVF
jgi:hypothetical protein